MGGRFSWGVWFGDFCSDLGTSPGATGEIIRNARNLARIGAPVRARFRAFRIISPVAPGEVPKSEQKSPNQTPHENLPPIPCELNTYEGRGPRADRKRDV